jgi:hypothetical protein
MNRILRTSHPVRRRRALPGALHPELRATVAAAHGLDPALLRRHPEAPVAPGALLDLLGETPVRTAADALTRLEHLVGELVARMDAAGWSPTAAPGAVTSVLAASEPAVEAVLLRHAGPLPTAAGGR